MEINQKLKIFKHTIELLNRKQIHYVVGASLLLYLDELVDNFNDADILIDLNDITKVDEIFNEICIEKKKGSNDKFASDYFQTYVVDELEFDVIGGFCIVDDGGKHYFPDVKVDHYVEFDEIKVPLDNLGNWLLYYELMGRFKKVEIIRKHLSQELNEYLTSVAKPNIIKYNCRVIPNIPSSCFIGVSIPKLRHIAKKIAKHQFEVFMLIDNTDYFDAVLLRGLVVAFHEDVLENKLFQVDCLLPYINDWETCDTIAQAFKFKKIELMQVYEYAKKLIDSQDTYSIRFGLVLLIKNFMKDQYYADIFTVLNHLHHDDYYVKMAVAWLISIMYVENHNLTLAYLKDNQLEIDVHNKAIQKICESLRVKQLDKQILKQLRK